MQILVEEHEKHPDNPYMFPSPKTGEMLDPASFRAMHDRILEAIGAEHVRFHDMRHPYVKHTTKNISCKSRNPKPPTSGNLGFLFLLWFD